MASTRLKTTKDGNQYYEIRVRVSRDKPELCTRWYIPKGWSQTAINRELPKQAAEFERKCKAGEVISRSEQKAIQEEATRKAEEEAARIKTFRQYGEKVFMPSKKITTAENTRTYYQGCLDNHLYPALGDKKLTEITSAELRSFFLKLQESNLAHSYLIGIYGTCKQLFDMAYTVDEIIDRNPMDKVKRPRRRKDIDVKQEVEAFTTDELKMVIACLENEPLKWNAFCRLLMDTGIRRGEACGLRWSDIDFTTNTATICGNLQYSTAKKYDLSQENHLEESWFPNGVYIQTPKTGKTRDVYFTAATAKLLQQLKEEQKELTQKRTKRLAKEGKPLDFDRISDSEFVFNEKGYCTPMTPQTPNRYFQKFGEKYGIDIHPHLLRHSFASAAITNGADIASVSEVLGHADKSTTLRMYTHADEESKRRAANIFHKAISQA